MRIDENSMADLYFRLAWERDGVLHEDCYFASGVNMWRDILPVAVHKEVSGRENGEQFSLQLNASDMGVSSWDKRRVKQLSKKNFVGRTMNGKTISPRFGRFYPQGLLKNVIGVFPESTIPFRCVENTNDHFSTDLNHPLAGDDLELQVQVADVWEKDRELGGSCKAWLEMLTDGPGMQARVKHSPTDFFESGAFNREDNRSDEEFYAQPRLTAHVDSRTLENIQGLHARLLTPGQKVLDLMSSVYSHFPEDLQLAEVKGLGMNSKEMEENPRLSEHRVHDLNQDPILPYADREFDAVVCSMSLEYLTSPFEVIQEVYRVLRPGGRVVLSFSHRWFPGKAVNIWTELHEFERLGLASELLLQNKGFTNVVTYSERGWPRPFDERDRYYPLLQLSDPLFAVTAEKRA